MDPTLLLLSALGVLGATAIARAMGFAAPLLDEARARAEAGRMPRWFEAVMKTPSRDRVHPAANPRHLDRNCPGLFIVRDRLFGTFEPERDDGPRDGIIRYLPSFKPLRAAIRERVGMAGDALQARSRRDLAGVTFGPAGWKPGEEGETADAIRMGWRQRQATGS